MGILDFLKPKKKEEQLTSFLPQEIYEAGVLELQDIIAPSALKISPKQLFSVLKFSSDTAKGVNFITVGDAPTNWIQFADVKYLVRFINSHEKCKCVIKVYSDYLPFDNYSTLGGQAMNLIDSYRKKEPYFKGVWNCAKNDSLRAKEIKTWWKSLNKKN